MLPILLQDEHLVAVNKPHGLLVHRSSLAKDASEFALQQLRDQLGQPVFPVHRIDRKTGGVLLFALNEDVHRSMQSQFANRKVCKIYWAIVRGYTEEEGTIDSPLMNENGKLQEANTPYRTLSQTEVPVPFGQHLTSRYSLVEVSPTTGRMHQIRRHFAHIRHPVIGDRPHGCNKQNRLFKEHWNMMTMLLHARELSFSHPITEKQVIIEAPLQDEFNRMIGELELGTTN